MVHTLHAGHVRDARTQSGSLQKMVDNHPTAIFKGRRHVMKPKSETGSGMRRGFVLRTPIPYQPVKW